MGEAFTPARPSQWLPDLIGRATRVETGEGRPLAWACFYFFCLLCGYYIIRPLRDEMGVAGGVEHLQWVFTGTFLVMLLAVPVFGLLVARLPRRRFLPVVYLFFIANLLIFYAVFRWGTEPVHTARAFFVWTSVFNLFVVSVFWSFMVDIFSTGQAKRLFGLVAAGGTVGALTGPTLTVTLVEPLGTVNLLLISALFLGGALLAIHRLLACTAGGSGPGTATTAEGGAGRPLGGNPFAGITSVLRSPYLLGIALFILLFTTLATFLYFQQAHIVSRGFDDPAERTRVFAAIDLVVNALTLLTQTFVTGRLMTRWGVGAALGLVPLWVAAGFAGLAVAPILPVLLIFQALRRAGNYAVTRPAREVLFTVVDREQRYKAKNFIDTVVYRGGDALSGWVFAGLTSLGLTLSGIAVLGVPLALAWLAVAIWLARRLERARGAGAVQEDRS